MSDPLGFESVFRCYAASLMRYAAAYTRSWSLAEDVVHDLFLHLWQQRDMLSYVERPRDYLFTAVRHRALNALRTRQRDDARAARWCADRRDERLAEPSPSAEYEEDERRHMMARAINSLPPARRKALHLRWRYGMTSAQIATTLGVSVKTIENQTSRAFSTLRHALPPLL